jgi:ABC-type oligopeptide transport system substrate-binding subunit
MDKPEAAIDYYQLNTKKPPMDDVRVRKAFNMAIDKAGLAAYQRTIKPLTAFSPEGIFPAIPSRLATPSMSKRPARCSPKPATVTPAARTTPPRFRSHRSS